MSVEEQKNQLWGELLDAIERAKACAESQRFGATRISLRDSAQIIRQLQLLDAEDETGTVKGRV